MKKKSDNAEFENHFPDFSQKSHFRHVGFYYSGAEKSVTLWTLFAGEHFGAQNAFWCPKMPFELRNGFFRPEMHFGVLFAPWPQMLMKPMVSASDFTLLGIKMRK